MTTTKRSTTMADVPRIIRALRAKRTEYIAPAAARPTSALVWLLAASCVCLIAWLLFTADLGRESMWHDEWITWEFAQHPDISSFFSAFPFGTTHPPLSFLWTWAWVKYTATYNLQIMRLAPVFVSMLAVAMGYRVGRDWFRSRWVGLGAAAFLATSGILVYYAREIRMYPLLTLLALVSWWLLWRAIRAESVSSLRPYARLFWYGVSVALVMYTHYFSVFMIVAQGLTVLLFYRRHLLRVVLAYVIALAVFLPWAPNAWTQMNLSITRSGGDATVDGGPAESTSLETLQVFVERYSAGQPAFLVTLTALAVMLGLRSSRAYLRQLRLVGSWLFLTGALMLIFNLFIMILYNSRYLMPTLPALALLVGVAVDRLPQPARSGVIAIVVVMGIFDHTAAFLPAHVPHRQLLGTVASNYMPGDRIWYNLDSADRRSDVTSEVEYYMEYMYPLLTPEIFVRNPPREFADVESVPRVWDIRSDYLPVPDDVEVVLTQGRSLSEEYRFSIYSVRMYEAPPPDETPTSFGDLFELLVGTIRDGYHPGDTVRLKTWWRAQQPIPLDYSYGLYLRNADGVVISQSDQGLTLDDAPTSQWQPSNDFGLIVPEITLPSDLAPGEYGIWMAAYYWEDPRPLEISAPDEITVDSGSNVVRIAQVIVTGD